MINEPHRSERPYKLGARVVAMPGAGGVRGLSQIYTHGEVKDE